MEGRQLIAAHFPELTDAQLVQLEHYVKLLKEQNQHLNLISRKNESRIWEEHILHSLSIAKAISFQPNTRLLDFGTGGGLPGIPLAIVFPKAKLLLVDSIGKKIRAVREMVDSMKLKNVRTLHARVEEVNESFDFAVSRAVTALPMMKRWLHGKIRQDADQSIPNGLLYIKGGDFEKELDDLKVPYRVWEMSTWFDDPFFETKKVVWIDVNFN